MIGILPIAALPWISKGLRRAGEAGLGQAWLELAQVQLEGLGCERSPQEAERSVQRAITLKVPRSEFSLAALRWGHRREEATEDEKIEAFEFARREAATESGEAMVLLGYLTCYGFGTLADPAAAFKIQQRAATLGNASALFELYVHLSTGLGVHKDEVAALKACREAAEKEHPRATYNLGAFYATGRGVPQDLAQSVRWYERSSETGNGKASAVLGMMCARGEGTKKDPVRAEELFSLADYQGFDVAAFRDSAGV